MMTMPCRACASNPAKKHAGMRSGEFELDRLILYESRLGSEGASYEPVMIQPLG